jgi:hypothetical protein
MMIVFSLCNHLTVKGCKFVPITPMIGGAAASGDHLFTVQPSATLLLTTKLNNDDRLLTVQSF